MKTKSNQSLVKLTVQHEGQGYDLWQAEGEEQRVLDLDLARWAGMRNPSKIVEMIGRHEADLKDLGDLLQKEIAPPARGGKARTATYLNEPQSLFLLAKMETPKAKAALKVVIQVYLKIKSADRLDIDTVRLLIAEALEQQKHEMLASLPAQTPDGLLGKKHKADVLWQLRMMAYALTPRTALPGGREWNKARMQQERKLRRRLAFDGKWEKCPAPLGMINHQISELWREVEQTTQRTREQVESEARERSQQLDLSVIPIRKAG